MLKSKSPTPTPNRVLSEALRLKPQERARIADRLIESLFPDPKVEAAWDKEIARRIREVDSGAVKTVPLKEALNRAFAPPRPKK